MRCSACSPPLREAVCVTLTASEQLYLNRSMTLPWVSKQAERLVANQEAIASKGMKARIHCVTDEKGFHCWPERVLSIYSSGIWGVCCCCFGLVSLDSNHYRNSSSCLPKHLTYKWRLSRCLGKGAAFGTSIREAGFFKLVGSDTKIMRPNENECPRNSLSDQKVSVSSTT